MAEPLELKKTLNLPKTDFPMKAGLPQNEPKQLDAWHGGNIYERILEVRKGKPLFVLHDGPPYPTGEIHLGTDRKSTRLNSSHLGISYAVFCLKKKNIQHQDASLVGCRFISDGRIDLSAERHTVDW